MLSSPLREGGTDVVERCRVSLEESRDEGIATGAGDQLAFIKVKHLPASIDEYWCSPTGPVDVLASYRLRRRGEVTGDCKYVGDDVVLCVRNRGPRQGIAPLPRGIVLVDDAAGQVAVLVIVADGMLVECTTVEDIEGAGAAATDNAGVIGTARVSL